jgi:hypothetical protein
MSIMYLLDPHLQVIRTTYIGVVTLADLVGYARSLAMEGLLVHPQLIDGREATLSLSESETREFSDVMTSLRAMFGRAPVAFVPGNPASHRIARWYSEMGAGSTCLGLFEEVQAAERWITKKGGREQR